MNAADFVLAVKKYAAESAVQATTKNLSKPPGRAPSRRLVELSKWYQHIDEQDREAVEQVARLSAESAVFGFLAILDGVRVVEESSEKGAFELYFRKGSQKVLLNNFEQQFLHDIFKSISEY